MDEICVLAGDIGNPYQSNYERFMEFVRNHFKQTFVIPGNHEYYNKTKTIEETNQNLKDYFNRFSNVRLLNNSCEMYGGHCFIGTTLWSKITNPTYEINDTRNIPGLDYIQYNRLNRMSVNFLEDAVANNDNCVVITHHVPSYSLIDVKYKTKRINPYNQWFYCDMDKFIETAGNQNKIKCWIYGHTHTPSNVTLNGIPFLCNPIGYPTENAVLNFSSTFQLN